MIPTATKALKGVDEGKWMEFKAIAANRAVSMGELFNEAVEVLAKENSRTQWEKLTEYLDTHTSKLTDADIKRMREFRKRFQMRRF